MPDTRIPLNLIDYDIVKDNRKNQFDFQNQLNKLKRQQADFVKCPDCHANIKPNETEFQEMKAENRLIEHCPDCYGILRILKKKTKS